MINQAKTDPCSLVVDDILDMILRTKDSVQQNSSNQLASGVCSIQGNNDAAGKFTAGLGSWKTTMDHQTARALTTLMDIQSAASLSSVATHSTPNGISLPGLAIAGTGNQSPSGLLQSGPMSASRRGSQTEGSTLSTVPTPAHFDNTSWQLFTMGTTDDKGVNKESVSPPARKQRGRKPSKSTSAKTPKDQNKENSIKVRELEAELQSKLSLVKQLEDQNATLNRKVRLLQLSMLCSEQYMNILVDHQLPSTLKNMLTSMRGAYNKANAEQILSKVSSIQQPQDMTMDMFRTTWQALVLELGDVLMRESMARTPEAKRETEAHLMLLMSHLRGLVGALRVNGSYVVRLAESTNLMTGEEVNTDVNFWADIANKLALSDEQIKDMLGGWEMFTQALRQVADEWNELTTKLDQALRKHNEDLLMARPDTICSTPESGDLTISSLMDKLKANLERYDRLHSLLTCRALRIMAPRQVALMCIHSNPLYPDILAVVQGLALRHGVHNSRSSTP